MNIWVSKDNAEYHYHVSHRAICGISDILQDVAQTHDTSENPEKKCTVCIGILTSRGFFRINQEKNKNMIKEARFVQKYRESPVSLFIKYLTSPENRITTIQKIRHELAEQFDGINTNDILAEALVHSDVICKDEKLYPKCKGVIPL